MATRYGLQVRGSNPGWCDIFRTVQTGPGAHKSFCTMSTDFYSVGKAAGVWRLPLNTSSANVQERVRLNF